MLTKMFVCGIIQDANRNIQKRCWQKGSMEMAKPKTKTRTEINRAYNESVDQIRLSIPKGTKDTWKSYAERNGESMQKFIYTAVEEKIMRLFSDELKQS